MGLWLLKTDNRKDDRVKYASLPHLVFEIGLTSADKRVYSTPS